MRSMAEVALGQTTVVIGPRPDMDLWEVAKELAHLSGFEAAQARNEGRVKI